MMPTANKPLTNIKVIKSTQPTMTYHVNKKTKRIHGMIDGRKALLQAIDKAINTETMDNIIYKNYGISLKQLIGAPKDYARTRLFEVYTECLKKDDRIIELANLIFHPTSEIDCICISFDVVTNDNVIMPYTSEVYI